MKNQKGLAPILIVLIIAVAIGGYLIYSGKINLPQKEDSQGSIFTYDECVKGKGSKIADNYYPKKCESPDGKTYIESVNKPVNTASWEIFKTGLGFSFKCPPSWSCKRNTEIKDIANVYQSHYSNISTFQFNIVDSNNFQESFLRHPRYKTPMEWFGALKTKNPIAIEVLPETIKVTPGTDQKIPPHYYDFNFDKMTDFETKAGRALVFPEAEYGLRTSIMVPLNNTDLVLVTLSPDYLLQDPIIEAIIASLDKE